MSNCNSTLTAERLREVLHYDPETGVFTNRKNRQGTARAGQKAGSVDKEGYLVIRVDYKHHKAHRLAWLYVYGEWPSLQIDHWDLDKSNNRIRNLRDVTGSTNMQNMVEARCDNKLGVRGVTPSGNKFRANIGFRGKMLHIGSYDTVEEASAAYKAKKKELHVGAVLGK